MPAPVALEAGLALVERELSHLRMQQRRVPQKTRVEGPPHKPAVGHRNQLLKVSSNCDMSNRECQFGADW